MHTSNWAMTDGGENGLGSCWGCKGGGREQADEEQGCAKQGQGNHNDAKSLIWIINDGPWEVHRITHRKVKTPETGLGGCRAVSKRNLYNKSTRYLITSLIRRHQTSMLVASIDDSPRNRIRQIVQSRQVIASTYRMAGLAQPISCRHITHNEISEDIGPCEIRMVHLFQNLETFPDIH